MTVELLIAPPAAGKTKTCIEKIRTTISKHQLAQVWVVVPDRLQASAFRRRLASAGGALGGYVGRFEDLYQHVLERDGIDIPVASAPLLHRLVQETVDTAIAEGEISHYASLQSAPGFHQALRDSFAELKRALIYPEQFIAFSRDASPAQQEMAVLYARYQARLRELNWSDQDGLGWLAVEALERNPGISAPIRLLVVDGFDSFTGVQLRALKLLAAQVGELLITFPAVIDSSRSAHRRFMPVIETICRELSPRVSELTNQPYLPPVALQLEEQILNTGGMSKQTASMPFLVETRSPADEAREALRWIKSRVLRDSIPLAECAIFTPSPDVYHPLLRAASVEFGIPLHFTQAESLRESPAISALLNLLALPTQNFKSRLLLNSLRSPYFDFSIDDETVDILENISQAACIVEGVEQWEETWERLAVAVAQNDADLDEERHLRDLPRGTEIENLRSSLAAFFACITPSSEPISLFAWIAWLENLLEGLHFYENASSERDQLACGALREVLRALVLSESVTGERLEDYDSFLANLQGTLDGAGLPEPFERDEPGLLVGRVTEARGVRYAATALLGLSEGIFPAVERPDPFLGEDLRQALGLEARLEREQAGLFYQAVTRADRYLLITRPYLSDDGENWEASPYWNAARSLFTKSAVQTIQPDQPRELADAASPQELLFWAVRGKSLPGRYADLQPQWIALRHARDVLGARRAKIAQGIYDGSADLIAPLMTERYSRSETWSASRLEAYGTCPQLFYIGTALDLHPRGAPELGLGVTQIGSILHKILEQVYRTAAAPGDPDSVLAQLPQAAQQVFDSAPRQYSFRPSPLWAAEQAEYLAILEKTIQALAEEGTDWTPLAYEQTFGIKNTPALSVDIGGEFVQLHGVIDRLDRNSNGKLRVIDYKTGSSHLAQNDLKDGRRLQLPVYALAARDALGLGEPAEGFYWQIQSAKASSLKLSKFKNEDDFGPEAAYQVVREHLARIVHGIRAGDFRPIPPQGGCPAYCPAAQWCWRFKQSW